MTDTPTTAPAARERCDRYGAGLDAVVAEHHPYTPRNCRCGWQGDSFSTHVVDAITAAGFTVTKVQAPGVDCPNCGGRGYFPGYNGMGGVTNPDCTVCEGTGWLTPEEAEAHSALDSGGET